MGIRVVKLKNLLNAGFFYKKLFAVFSDDSSKNFILFFIQNIFSKYDLRGFLLEPVFNHATCSKYIRCASSSESVADISS